MISIMIAVCTFQREASLRRCIQTIQAMHIPKEISLDIVVIDNEPSQKIATLCMDQKIRYVAEPRRGLVFARNAVLYEARNRKPDFLGIIDDDETVSENWLIDMMAYFEQTDADVLSGIIDIHLDPMMPRYFKKAYQFKICKHPTVVSTLPMGNIMIKSTLLAHDLTFDPQFNHSGGEDIDFFKKAHDKGFKLLKIPAASVKEYLMPEKASLWAFLKRQIRVSKLHYAQKYQNFSIAYLMECGLSLLEISIALVILPITLLSDSMKIKVIKLIGKAIGRILSRQKQQIHAYG